MERRQEGSWQDVYNRHRMYPGKKVLDPEGKTVVVTGWEIDSYTGDYRMRCDGPAGFYTHWPANRLQLVPKDTEEEKAPLDTQVGGSHYKAMKLQPIEACYQRYGIEGVKAAVHVKVDKYLGRNKNCPIEDIDKAIHCLQLLKEFYQQEKANG